MMQRRHCLLQHCAKRLLSGQGARVSPGSIRFNSQVAHLHSHRYRVPRLRARCQWVNSNFESRQMHIQEARSVAGARAPVMAQVSPLMVDGQRLSSGSHSFAARRLHSTIQGSTNTCAPFTSTATISTHDIR